ncbi:hypothetical protein [Pukyongiella litopenaei]|uniref:Uncharacterized protein n=1 Tax=Pukyongiella litopenaei TaxID=2605946 RepID=A0A5C2H957_9RHOB|nr:hypothetical protein [Pukyongiella litopenaei]QEP30329.1 hypothetical protein C6Y53_19050 [Pukyongiella litopenaei]
MARIVVDTGDIELTPDAEANLRRAVHRAVLDHVAGAGAGRPVAVAFPDSWHRSILRPHGSPCRSPGARTGAAPAGRGTG